MGTALNQPTRWYTQASAITPVSVAMRLTGRAISTAAISMALRSDQDRASPIWPSAKNSSTRVGVTQAAAAIALSCVLSLKCWFMHVSRACISRNRIQQDYTGYLHHKSE